MNTEGLGPFIGIRPQSLYEQGDTLLRLDFGKINGLKVFGDETDHLLSLQNLEDFYPKQVLLMDHHVFPILI